MPGGIATTALLAALATALVVAAVTDIRRRQIDNGLNAAIALAAPLFWIAIGLSWTGIGVQLALAAGTFAIACGLFATGQMGGGDVKLLTALALWFPPGPFLQLIVLMAILGGGGSVAMAALNMRRTPGSAWFDGIAFAAAILWVCVAAGVAYALVTGRPMLAPGTLDTAIAGIGGVALTLVLLLVLGVVVVGVVRVMRRQKSRLRVPYGVAIAAAALWVVIDRMPIATPFAA